MWTIIILIILSPIILATGFLSLAIIYGIVYTMILSIRNYILKIIGDGDERTK